MISKLDLVRIVNPFSSEYDGKGIRLRGRNKSFSVVRELVNSFRDSVSNNKLKDLNNDYLIESLTKFNYKNSRDYSLGMERYDTTMSMKNGILIVASTNSSLGEVISSFLGKFISKSSNVGSVKVVSYFPNNRSELDKVILYLMKLIKNVNIYEEMIKFRLFSVLESDSNIKRLSDQLDNSRIYNYGVDSKIPNDVPSINYDPLRFIINLPDSLNDYQYDINDYLRELGLRNKSEYSRNLIRFIVKDKVNPQVAYKITTFLIDIMGYTIICPGTKF